MTTEYTEPAEQPVLLSSDELTAIAGSLPAGSTAFGGVRSTEKAQVPPGAVAEPVSSVIVFSANDDHTIHRMVVDEVKPGHFEIVSDTVVGTW